MTINTRILYRFKDDLFKDMSAIVLAGRISDQDKEDIARALRNGNGFIPEQIGIKPLRPSGSDQVWHTMDIVHAVETVEKDCGISCEEFKQKIKNTVWHPAKVSRNMHTNSISMH